METSTDERRLAALRQQMAIVRSLLDAFDSVTPSSLDGSAPGQVAEELTRLGCRALEAAVKLATLGAPAVAEMSAEGIGAGLEFRLAKATAEGDASGIFRRSRQVA